MFADLHLHTFFSDGTFSPEEVVAHGKRMGFAALALTDHDTIEGCERMAAACAAERIEFIVGSELTAEFSEHELHILGYFLDPRHPRLLGELAKFQEVRQNRIRDMVTRINGLGVPLNVDDVFALANCRAPGRPHVARALVKAGYCTSLDEAFERFRRDDPYRKIACAVVEGAGHIGGAIPDRNRKALFGDIEREGRAHRSKADQADLCTHFPRPPFVFAKA